MLHMPGFSPVRQKTGNKEKSASWLDSETDSGYFSGISLESVHEVWLKGVMCDKNESSVLVEMLDNVWKYAN